MAKISDHTLSELKDVVGPKGWSNDDGELEPHLREWRGRWHGKTSLLLKPKCTKEISDILVICNKHKCKIVPQGGNTGLVNGGLPDDSGDELLLSLKRFNKEISIDPVNNTITADSGITVKQLQDVAASQDRLFPLSLASEGSCTVGGIISTNAGGVHVVRYGTTRDLVLGLEAVMPNGDIINALSGLRKNNTGYNIPQLLIGAEGTLGIITKATFKLYPAVKQRHVMMLGVDCVDDATKILHEANVFAGENLSAFELISQNGLDIALKHTPNLSAPYPTKTDWYLLIEFGLTSTEASFSHRLENWLEQCLDKGIFIDGSIAQNEHQSQSMWTLRERMSEVQKLEGASVKHDISIPISNMAKFIERANTAVNDICKGVRAIPFGHLGDGNLHYNLSQPIDMNQEDFMALEYKFNNAVYDIVMQLDGSISAEHGIGKLKVQELEKRIEPNTLATMRSIKRAIDPNNILNCDRIFKITRLFS